MPKSRKLPVVLSPTREATGIYEEGLKRVPNSGLFKQNREYCVKQQG